MAPPAATILAAKSKPRRTSCICGTDSCKQLTICFQSVGDVRGNYMQMPRCGGSQLAGLKEHKIKRTLVHFNQYSSNKDAWQCTIDRRTSKGGGPRQMVLRGEEEKVVIVQSKKYVANHHFHPEILQLMLHREMTNIDCITEEAIRELGLVDNGYTAADLYRGQDVSAKTKSMLTLPDGTTDGPYYVPVPSYKRAKDDYKLVSTKWRLNKMIKECREKCRGRNSTLAPRRGEDNDVILQPVEKRARVKGLLPALEYDSVDDLQRAICMLSEELEEAYADIERLKSALSSNSASS